MPRPTAVTPASSSGTQPSRFNDLRLIFTIHATIGHHCSVESEMDYQKHYDLLIERARARVLQGYVEVHHVVPRCLGGGDEKENLVQLTAEEHYLAHQLLHKLHPSVKGLLFSVISMSGNRWGNRNNNKSYGWIRRKNAILQSENSLERWADPAYREKHQQAMDVLRSDPEYVARVAKALSETHKGRVKSVEERANIAEAGRNRKPRVFSEQARLNMAEARRKTWQERREAGTINDIAVKTKATREANGSYQFSDAHRAAISESAKGRTPWNKGMKLKQSS